MENNLPKGPGGTEGGYLLFAFGALLALAGTYLFFDSVRLTTETGGVLSGLMAGRGGGGRGGMWETTSMGIIFMPFLIGIIALFFNYRMKWAWVILGLGIILIGVEIVSRFRFLFSGKLTHFLGMLVLFGAGLGLMLRSYWAAGMKVPKPPGEEPPSEEEE